MDVLKLFSSQESRTVNKAKAYAKVNDFTGPLLPQKQSLKLLTVIGEHPNDM